MERSVLSWVCVCALCVVPLVGCGETAGGGGGGDGGDGGAGGMPKCENPGDCDDRNQCTEDTCADGVCQNSSVENGTECGDGAGTCRSGSCSGTFACTEAGIRDAIEVGGGPHTFDCDGPTPVVTQAEIFVDNDVILDGEGNLTVDGDKEHRVFSVSENVTVELRGLTVTGGSSLPPDFGGGIFNGGKLTLVNTVVRDNIAQDDFECCRDPSWNAGGGIHNDGELTLVSSTVSGNAAFTGGGIASHGGELTMSNSTISGNTAADGGGIYNGGVSRISNSTISGNTAADGAGIYNGVDAALTTTNSVVSENTAGQDGGGIYNSLGDVELAASTVLLNTAERGGGGIYNHGELTMTSSTIWRNVAEGTDDCPNPNPCPGGGGGIFNLRELTMTNSTVSANTSKSGGGGVSNRDVGSCTLINSTLSGNTARDDGGGISNRDRGSYTLINCTVSGNAAPQGSAMSKSGNQSVTIRNSLVDGDCTGPSDFTSNSYNVESPGDTCGFHQEGDQVDVSSDDLKVGPLQDNGGPTETHALGAGSVAIDQIPVEDCVDADGAPLTTDQRGEPRPGGTMCDVGAFEVQP